MTKQNVQNGQSQRDSAVKQEQQTSAHSAHASKTDCECNQMNCENSDHCEDQNSECSEGNPCECNNCECKSNTNTPNPVEQLKIQVGQLTELLQLKQAEFENALKRQQTILEEQRKLSTEHIIKQLLPILDNFHLSLKHTSNQAEFEVGVRLICQQLDKMLENNNVKPLQLEGKPFDGSKAICIQTIVDKTKPENIVITEIERAYTLHDKVIKMGKVTVAKHG